MTRGHEVRIVMSDAGIGRVWIDDNEILGVTAIEMSMKAGGIPQVKLELIPGNLEYWVKLSELGAKMEMVDDTAKPVGGGERDGRK